MTGQPWLLYAGLSFGAAALAALILTAAVLIRPAAWAAWRQAAGAGTGADSARGLEALHARVRVADELARAERDRAINATAGIAELLRGLVAAEEGARGQLSAELHDTVAQSLLLARSELANRQPDLDNVRDLIIDAEEQLRAVMARTKPPALRDGDLASAVAALRADLAHRYGLQVTLRWPETPYPLPLVAAVTVYRFFQEALLNVVKHSTGDGAEATLAVQGATLVASVRDEGPGFDPSAVPMAGGGRRVGLSLMQERLRLAGGSLNLESTPGGSTTLTMRLPLSAPRDLPAAAPVAATAGSPPAAAVRRSSTAARTRRADVR